MNIKKIITPTHLLFMGALLSLSLMMVRVLTVISFAEPRHVVTSGFEEESLLAIWKYLHGMAIYQDPHQLPFTASYFNWLFYQIYGAWTAFFINVFHLEESWIPTVTRCLTLVMVFLGGGLTYRLLSENGKQTQNKLLALSLTMILWGGPLLGFWAMTTRPDVLALFFDVCAAYFFLKYFDKKLLLAIGLGALGCYLSWACKQINIVMPLSIGLFLLYHKRFQAFLGFSTALISLYGLTLWLAPPAMLSMLFFIKTAIPLSLTVLIANLMKFLAKTFPLWIIGSALATQALFNPTYKRWLFENNRLLLGMAGLIAWMLTLLPASSKVGSADNYHFICLFFITLVVNAGLSYQQGLKPYVKLSQGIAGVLFCFAIVFSFTNGSLQHLRQQHEELTALETCLKALPQPTFCVNHYGALPWMLPDQQPFVLAYNYWSDRQAGCPFAENGIGGLISKQYFKSLILPEGIKDNFDGAALSGYVPQAISCQGYTVYKLAGA
jgi:hypothetical protein